MSKSEQTTMTECDDDDDRKKPSSTFPGTTIVDTTEENSPAQMVPDTKIVDKIFAKHGCGIVNLLEGFYEKVLEKNFELEMALAQLPIRKAKL